MNKHERLHSFIGSFIERKSRGVVASQQQQRLFTYTDDGYSGNIASLHQEDSNKLRLKA